MKNIIEMKNMAASDEIMTKPIETENMDDSYNGSMTKTIETENMAASEDKVDSQKFSDIEATLYMVVSLVIIIVGAALLMLNPPSGKDPADILPDDIFGAKKPTPNHGHSKIHTDWLLIIITMATIIGIVCTSLEPLASSSIKGKPKRKEVEGAKGIEMATFPEPLNNIS